MEQIISKNQIETEKIGQDLAQEYLYSGGVIFLTGDLGAGKTAFVRGFAKGLGITRTISSPTFVFLKIYDRLYHLDLYRLENPSQFEMLGVREIIESDPKKIFIIEWPDKANLNNIFAKKITFLKTKSDNERIITIE